VQFARGSIDFHRSIPLNGKSTYQLGNSSRAGGPAMELRILSSFFLFSVGCNSIFMSDQVRVRDRPILVWKFISVLLSNLRVRWTVFAVECLQRSFNGCTFSLDLEEGKMVYSIISVGCARRLSNSRVLRNYYIYIAFYISWGLLRGRFV